MGEIKRRLTMKKQMVGDVPGNVLGMIADLALKLQHEGGISLEEFGAFLRKEHEKKSQFISLKNFSYSTEWNIFYHDYFGLETMDLSKIIIPKRREGLNRLLIIPENMDFEIAYDACQSKFSCWINARKSLSELIDWAKEERDPRKGAYAIWVRDRREADKELKNLSVDNLKEKNIPGITLTERLVYELKYFAETGKHLDAEKTTLCSGSCLFNGCTINVSWGRKRVKCLSISWSDLGVAGEDLRSREVIEV